MSAQLQGLRSLIYPSSDVATAKAWWSDFLGFGPYFDEPFYVGFNVGGYELGLVASDDGDDVPTTLITIGDVVSPRERGRYQGPGTVPRCRGT